MPDFYNQFVAIGEETTWGTPVARNAFARVYPGTKLFPTIERRGHQVLGRRTVERFLDVSEKGEGRLILDQFYGHSAAGNILGKLLKHTLGVYAVSGAGPYVHTFTVKDGGPPFGAGAVAAAQGLSVEAHYALPDTSLESRLLEGGMITDAKLLFGVGEGSLRCEFGLLGQQVTQVVKTGSPTFPDYDTYLQKPSQVAVSIDGTDASTAVESVEVNIATGLREYQRVGSRYISQPVPQGKLTVTGTIRRDWLTATPAAKAMWDKFISGATAAIVITVTGPTNYSWVVTLSKAVYMGGDLEMEEGGLLPVEFPFEAEYDATNTALKIAETSLTLTTY